MTYKNLNSESPAKYQTETTANKSRPEFLIEQLLDFCTEDQLLETISILCTHYSNNFLQGKNIFLTNPQAARRYVQGVIGFSERENFLVVFLNIKHEVLADEILFSGTVDGASIYPREVVKRALELNASTLILAHNHPSGDTIPSEPDKTITKRLQEACRLVDIKILDHIIVGPENDYSSFAELGLL